MSDSGAQQQQQQKQQGKQQSRESLPERAAVAVEKLSTATAQVDEMKLPAESKADNDKATRVVDSLLEAADKEEERTHYGSA